MGKWNGIVVIMMLMVIVTVEATKQTNELIPCFQTCFHFCQPNEGNCFERCKIYCGGPNPPHGPSTHINSPRVSRGMTSMEATKETNGWIPCFQTCSQPCQPNDGNCFERCKIDCGGPNPPHGPSTHTNSPRVSRGMTSMEATKQTNDWVPCFQTCSQPCQPNDGDCFERCKIGCGGPNPPHGPSTHTNSPRVSRRMTSIEATKQTNDWIPCFQTCSQPCQPNDGNCFERCKIGCGGPNPPHGPSAHTNSPWY